MDGTISASAIQCPMIKLVTDAGGEGLIEFELRPGTSRVGRGADNDLVVDHESVSEAHCELHLTEQRVVVRDLGSLNGTWVDGTQIDEVSLESGQTLQVGLVRFTLLGELDGQTPFHEQGNNAHPALGELHCDRCGHHFHAKAASGRRVGKEILQFCPKCGSQCGGTATKSRQPKEPRERTFCQGLAGAFNYPFRAGGGALLVTGAVALTITDYAALIASYAFLLGLVALLILAIGVTGYLFAFIKNVVTSSSAGDDAMPGWPEAASPADFIGPFLQFLALVLFCFGPFIAWSIWSPDWGGAWVSLILAAGGAFYFPMALLAVSMGDSIGGVNPALVLPSILRILNHYVVAFVLVLGVMALQTASGWFMELIPVPVVPTLLTEFVTLYLMIVSARVLGLMYHVNREKLGWFGKSR